MKRDVVYFVKESVVNEELTYSLRTVERNFPHRHIWMYGGCPANLNLGEHHIPHRQVGMKWNRVRNMLRTACDNDNITEDFWLFNDDFFIVKPIEKPENYYHGTLEQLADEIEDRAHPSIYTMRLRELASLLKREGYETKNYALHVPMLINCKKMAQVLDNYEATPMFRALYGNYWQIGGTDRADVKIRQYVPLDCMGDIDLISSSDSTWIRPVGQYIRERFKEPSKYEK